MKNAFKTLVIVGLALSFIGCTDDDDKKKVNAGAVAQTACTKFVQCEGKLGYLPSDASAERVNEEIKGCNDVLLKNFLDKESCNEAASTYLGCVQGLSCEAIHPVYQSRGQTVPADCQDKYNSLTSCKSGSGGGGDKHYDCRDNPETCYCISHEECEWDTDYSCVCP